MLRLIRRSFAWGMGDVISRDWQRYDAECEAHERAAVEMDVQGKPQAASHKREQAKQARITARTLRRLGWTTWLEPRAPSADGRRKVVWQSRSREIFFNIFALIAFGVQARMFEVQQIARLAAEADGRHCTKELGVRTKECELGGGSAEQ